jgi:hypothetical protein
MKYVGQTGRTFRTRYREHIQDIKYNKNNSKYAPHILKTGYTYGPINKIMKILHIEKKSQNLNTLEKFEIYKLTKNKRHLNDVHRSTINPIFDIILTTYPHT